MKQTVFIRPHLSPFSHRQWLAHLLLLVCLVFPQAAISASASSQRPIVYLDLCPLLQTDNGDSLALLDMWDRQWGLTVTGFIIDGNGPAMGDESLDAYARFSPHGIVPQKCPPLTLHDGMPVLRADWNLVDAKPTDAASVLLDRVHDRPLPFHWFRSILKSPTWHCQLKAEVESRDSSIVFLTAPDFFELLNLYSQQQKKTAKLKK